MLSSSRLMPPSLRCVKSRARPVRKAWNYGRRVVVKRPLSILVGLRLAGKGRSLGANKASGFRQRDLGVVERFDPD